jgi:hypothetical protein
LRLALADAAALVLFTTVGLISHGFEPAGYARDALPLLGCWFAVALGLRLYPRAPWRRVLLCWILAVPAAWLLRALVLGRAFDGGELAFLGITLVFSLAFVAGLRALVTAASA